MQALVPCRLHTFAEVTQWADASAYLLTPPETFKILKHHCQPWGFKSHLTSPPSSPFHCLGRIRRTTADGTGPCEPPQISPMVGEDSRQSHGWSKVADAVKRRRRAGAVTVMGLVSSEACCPPPASPGLEVTVLTTSTPLWPLHPQGGPTTGEQHTRRDEAGDQSSSPSPVPSLCSQAYFKFPPLASKPF